MMQKQAFRIARRYTKCVRAPRTIFPQRASAGERRSARPFSVACHHHHCSSVAGIEPQGHYSNDKQIIKKKAGL